MCTQCSFIYDGMKVTGTWKQTLRGLCNISATLQCTVVYELEPLAGNIDVHWHRIGVNGAWPWRKLQLFVPLCVLAISMPQGDMVITANVKTEKNELYTFCIFSLSFSLMHPQQFDILPSFTVPLLIWHQASFQAPWWSKRKLISKELGLLCPDMKYATSY